MKTRIAVSTFALIIGLYGITPAMAESFNERGTDWKTTSPMPTTHQAESAQTPSGPFASSWGRGKTPSQYEAPSSASARLDTGQSCDLTPRVGFNQSSHLTTC